ncbi:MAG: ribonuclease [Mogibacterium sp.]|nr:ribonuclease [Mogibacterium sp.]
MKRKTRTISVKLLLVLLLCLGLVSTLASCGRGTGGNTDTGTAVEQSDPEPVTAPEGSGDTVEQSDPEPAAQIDENGEYTSHEEVALYIHTYHKLPPNYMTKQKAEEKGWKSDPQKHGIAIGGNRFGNYEGLLPEGEKYYECDVDYPKKGRGKCRLIYTKNGTVYYTNDHYESFEQLY